MATALIAVSASPAGASVTIGQLAPGPPSGPNCIGGPVDSLQATVASGDPYAVPATVPNGVVTSWSHNAATGSGQMLTMKIFRKVPGPFAVWMAVGHDGPRPLSSGQLNTFATRIPVQAGDLVGNNAENAGTVHNACVFTSGGGAQDLLRRRLGNLADGESGFFTTQGQNQRINVTAVVEADCDNDGFGDETQDQDISSCAPPPPGTTPPPAGIPPPGSPPGTPPVTCKGLVATIVGTDGSDVRAGSLGQDVIAGLGGNDTLSGLGGNDLICGGAGKDTLKGGKGKDSLLGQAGKDALKGGGGKDICKGGKGNDTASKCEVEKSI